MTKQYQPINFTDMTSMNLAAIMAQSNTAYYIGFTSTKGHKTRLLPHPYFTSYDEAWERMEKLQPRYKHRLEVFKVW